MQEKTSINIKINYTRILTMIFIVLKLTGVINWSWFWVISPLLIKLIICMILLLILGF